MKGIIKRIICFLLVITMLGNDIALTGEGSPFCLRVQAKETGTEDSGEEEGEETDGTDEDDEDAMEESADDSYEIQTGDPEEDAVIIQELTEKREPCSKEYLLSDQSHAVMLYTEPVHYRTEDGDLAEIDNSLILTETGYCNAANSYHVLFNNQAGERGEVHYAEDGYEIHWSLLEMLQERVGESTVSGNDTITISDNDLAQAAVSENEAVQEYTLPKELEAMVEEETVDPEDEEALGHVIRQSAITFRGYQNGVSLEYIPQSEGIKENIILSTPQSGNTFTFRVSLKGLKARQNDRNQIELYDEETQEIKYYFPEPFMVDAENRVSYDAAYSLQKTTPVSEKAAEAPEENPGESPETVSAGDSGTVSSGDHPSVSSGDWDTVSNGDAVEAAVEDGSEDQPPVLAEEQAEEIPEAGDGCVYLTITLDEEWLSGAAYPVVVDPVLKKYKKDSIVDCGSVNDLGTVVTDKMYAGAQKKTRKEPRQVYRSFLRFSLPALPAQSIISTAELYFEKGRSTDTVQRNHYLTIHKATEDCYLDQNLFSGSARRIVNMETLPAYGDALDYAIVGSYFNITKAVREWYAGTSPNYGFVIKAYDEDKEKRDFIRLVAGSNKPYLKLTYRNAVGLEDYWSFHETSAGTSGAGYINDYTGALTLINEDVATVGNRLTFSLQHVYHSQDDRVFPSVGRNGWSLNYNQTIHIPLERTDIKEYPYVYTDEDGTEHYFKAADVTYLENGVKKKALKSGTLPAAADEDGLKLYIVPVTDKTLKKKYPLKLINQSASTVRYFDTFGRLAMITDSNQYENGGNSKTKEQNRVLLTYEDNPAGEALSTAGYQTAAEQLDILYEYSRKAVKLIDPATRETYAVNASAAVIALLYDGYAQADYTIAADILKAKTALDAVNPKSSSQSVVRSKTKIALDALKRAGEKAETLTAQSNQRLARVTDAVNRTADIFYDEAGRICAITDPGKGEGAKNQYSYDAEGRLIRIDYATKDPSEKRKQAFYQYENGLLVSQSDEDGYTVTYTYDQSHAKRIVRVSEAYVKEGEVLQGQMYTMQYGEDNTTIFRYSGVDDIHGNEDDIENVHVFDEQGRPVCIYSRKTGEEQVIGAAAYTYDDTVSSQAARTTYNDQNDEKVVNLLRNTSFESLDTVWKTDYFNAEVSLCRPDAYLGKQGARIVLHQAAESPDFGCIYQEIELEAGTYTISAFVKADNFSEDAMAVLYACDQSWNLIGDGRNLGGIAQNSDWIKAASTFTLENKKTVRICLEAGGKSGTVCFDCVQLETGRKASGYTNQDSVGASAAQTSSEEEKKTTRNKIKDCAVTGMHTNNLLRNHSMEFQDSATWTQYSTEEKPDSAAMSGYSSKKNYIGARCAYIDMAKRKQGIAGYEQTASVKEGIYTLSGYCLTTALKNTEAYLVVEDAAGNIWYSKKLTAATSAAFDNGWERLTLTFPSAAPQDIRVRMETSCTAATGAGIVAFDCLQLEQGETASPYNILEDGSFELATGSLPYKWTSYTAVNYSDEIVEGGIDGSKCYHITGEPGKDKYLKFTTNLGSSTGSYVLSGWVKADTTPIRKGRELKVRAYHKDDSSELQAAQAINAYSGGWKYFSLILPAHQWKSTMLSIQFFDNIGDLYIDGLQLTKNEVQTKKYNSRGQVTSRYTVTKSDTYGYDTYGRLNKMVTAGGVTTAYTYNKSNENTKIAASVGPNAHMKYDKYGNLISTALNQEPVENEDGTKTRPVQLYSVNTYTENGNFPASTQDNRGYETKYTYDDQGLLLDTELPDQTVIQYQYDSRDRLESVTQADRSVTYAYGEMNDLTAIRHNGFCYGYTHDAFGNVLTTSIAGQTVRTNVYNPYNGSLKYILYPGGRAAANEYDAYGKVVNSYIGTAPDIQGGEITDRTITDSYLYYKDGAVARHTDYLGNQITEYVYNDAGLVVQSRTRTADSSREGGIDTESEMQYTYTATGKVGALSYREQDGVVKTSQYAYAKDELPIKDTLAGGGIQTKSYDSLRRNSKTVYVPRAGIADGKRLYTTVSFEKGKASSSAYVGTTSLISRYVNKFGSSGKAVSSFQYTYDARQNVTSIAGLNGEKREYTYDVFGQVTSAVETYGDGTTLTYAYTYDAGGNLLTEVITDADGNAVTHTYEYAQDWKDQLVRYDGQEITYAENQVGCPASYRGMTLTWDELQGKLTGISRDGKELARYAYASDGTRYEKTAGGHTTAYHYNNGLLLSQTTDTEKLNFYYDSAGKVLQLGYQKKTETGWDTERTYFFARNAFGDIIAVYRNSDSKLMGTYEYDLWGRPVSMKEAAAGIDTDNILELNPYRYRGYYYDAESGLYYLNARYYDPEARRFVNADDMEILDIQENLYDKNLFAYCDDNPICRVDEYGNLWELALAGGGTIAATWSVGGSNFWNPVGWVVLGVAVVATTIYVGYKLYEYINLELEEKNTILFQKSKPKTGIIPKGGHDKGKSKSNKNKHEMGDARRKRDQGGSKARNNGDFKSRSNKRR